MKPTHPLWTELAALASTEGSASIAERLEHHECCIRQLDLPETGITLDYSKNTATPAVLDTLQRLFTACRLHEALTALLNGAPLNNTEHRPALHCSFRAALAGEHPPQLETINDLAQQSTRFADSLHSGQTLGYRGDPITDVVNIGIGGSDLGPRMVVTALNKYCQGACRVHFVSSIDSRELEAALTHLQPETTLFLISSKSFTTEETLCNAQSAITWFQQRTGRKALEPHFAALTGNAGGAIELGIAPDAVFDVPPWVGGRYSIWSASGMAAMIALGSDGFDAFLRGAHTMDQHAQNAHMLENMPAILAALEIWHCNFLGYRSLAVVPYDYTLRLLPAYLQQLVMESNGKFCDRNGQRVTTNTAPIVWGTSGTEGQHSYHQLLHQGTQVVPVDFILPMHGPAGDRSKRLASHCLAQSKALMEGKTLETAYEELIGEGKSEDEARALAPHKVMPGNRPSNTLLVHSLTPASLGALIALYEHKTFFTSVIWDINPFDQWGVELGKQLSSEIYSTLTGKNPRAYDRATDALLAIIQRDREGMD